MKAAQKELIVLIVAGVVFIVLGWIFAIRPVSEKLRSIRQQILVARERAELISEVHQLKSKNQGAENLFAEEGGQHDLTARLSILANENGINFESLMPTVEAKDPYASLILHLKAQAGFLFLIRFLEKLEEFRPLVALSEMSVTSGSGYARRGKENNDMPQVDLTLETYLRKKRGTRST